MTCKQVRKLGKLNLSELAESTLRAVLAHARECAACARWGAKRARKRDALLDNDQRKQKQAEVKKVVDRLRAVEKIEAG